MRKSFHQHTADWPKVIFHGPDQEGEHEPIRVWLKLQARRRMAAARILICCRSDASLSIGIRTWVLPRRKCSFRAGPLPCCTAASLMFAFDAANGNSAPLTRSANVALTFPHPGQHDRRITTSPYGAGSNGRMHCGKPYHQWQNFDVELEMDLRCLWVIRENIGLTGTNRRRHRHNAAPARSISTRRGPLRVIWCPRRRQADHPPLRIWRQ